MMFYTAAINGVFAALIAGGLMFTQRISKHRIFTAGYDFLTSSLPRSFL